MEWRDPHRSLEPLEREIAIVDDALAALLAAGVLAHAEYDREKMLAHRAAVGERFEIPWTAITPRMQRLLYAINAIARPDTMIAVGVFCGNTFIANAGAAVGPGACYRASRLIGLEIKPEEAARAARNVAAIDPEGRARILAQDGVPFLRAIDGSVDLLYLDADGASGRGKSIYLDLLEAAQHALRPGSLVLAHNSVNAAAQLTDYLNFVRGSALFSESVNLAVDGEGLEVSQYAADSGG
jgi:predicted O-methyltransferase YrrM